jgi:threonyl-tRNA synthetase
MIAVVGEREASAKTVSIRTRGSKDTATHALNEFIVSLTEHIKKRSG